MRSKEPVKQILIATRDYWDRPETRPSVRQNFDRVTKCRTLALGAEVFASENEEKKVPHTCKSRACPTCGHRATQLWQREQWAALPDIPYSGVVLTMPDRLWPIYQQNRHLLQDLAALGAAMIQQWVKARYGVRVLVMVVQHTFGRRLNFNPHLHTLVSAGGLQESEGCWIAPLRFEKNALMHMWRYAVITYLREALKAKVLTSEWSSEELTAVLTTQYERWWNIDIDHFKSKWQFLRYAGRYIRRPPIAQHRFRGDHGSRSPVLEEGPETEAASANSVFDRGVRRHSCRARAGSLPTRDSLFRIAGPRCQTPDLCGPIHAAGAGEAPSSITAELGEFVAKAFRGRSARR